MAVTRAPLTFDMSLTITPGPAIPVRAELRYTAPDGYARTCVWQYADVTRLARRPLIGWQDVYTRTLTAPDGAGEPRDTDPVEVCVFRPYVAPVDWRPPTRCDVGPLSRLIAEYVRDTLPTVVAVIGAD